MAIERRMGVEASAAASAWPLGVSCWSVPVGAGGDQGAEPGDEKDSRQLAPVLPASPRRDRQERPQSGEVALGDRSTHIPTMPIEQTYDEEER
jgi:hypothetical protein